MQYLLNFSEPSRAEKILLAYTVKRTKPDLLMVGPSEYFHFLDHFFLLMQIFLYVLGHISRDSCDLHDTPY